MDNDDEDEERKEDGNALEEDDKKEEKNDFELDTEEEDTLGELKVKDREGKVMRTFKEWMSDTKEFVDDYAGVEVKLSDKHKKIFETVNKLNK